jgi:hypothetical protein
MTTVLVNVRCRSCGAPCGLDGCPCTYPPITDTSRDAVCKRIKAALRARSGKDWSVTGGRGTAYGWIAISVPKRRLGCARLHDFDYQTWFCRICGRHKNEYDGDGLSLRRTWLIGCDAHVCTDACYPHYITPEEREELATLLGLDDVHFQGESIPSSIGHYVEYIDRAEGRPPRTIGRPYWD